MLSFKYLHASLAAALLCAPMLSVAQQEEGALAPIVQCLRAGPFGVLEHKRLPANVKIRSVETARGPKLVSIIDGHNLILATPQGLPFINVRVELSLTETAAGDRAAIAEQMQFLSSKQEPGDKALQQTTQSGVEISALHRATLERKGAISFYTLVVPARNVIATAYILNQEPADKRAFATYAEYEVLRDKAVALMQTCLAPAVAPAKAGS